MYESIELSKLTNPPSRDPDSLRHLVAEVKDIMKLATAEDLAFAKYVDLDLSVGIYDIVRRYCGDICQSDINRLNNLRRSFGEKLHEIKQIYRMPRPYLLAKALGVDLPSGNLISVSGVGWSYPSVHAAGSRYLAHLICKDYKTCLGDLGRCEVFDYANRVAMSRVHIGVHSLQDVCEGIRLADIVSQNPY